ncbi:hypothetical protein [Bradyrhizobium sp. AZCC 1693]
MTHQRVRGMMAGLPVAARRIWNSRWLKAQRTSLIPKYINNNNMI